jgi:hypothetical protein
MKTCKRMGVKQVAQRKSFADLLADMNSSIEANMNTASEVSITGAADGVPYAAPRVPKRKLAQHKTEQAKATGAGKSAAQARISTANKPPSKIVPKKVYSLHLTLFVGYAVTSLCVF